MGEPDQARFSHNRLIRTENKMAGETGYQFMSLNVNILKLMGLWPDDTHDRWRYLKMAVVSVLLSPTLVPLFWEFITVLIDPEPDIVYRIQVVLAEVCALGAAYILVCFIRNRADIKDLVDGIRDFDAFSDLDLKVVDQEAAFFSKIVLGYSLSGMVIYTLSPLLSRESCEIRKSRYRIDHGIPCGIIVPIRLPFKYDVSPVFEIWIVNEVVNGVVIVLVIVNITMMICGLLEHVINQLKEIRRFIRKISEMCDDGDIEESVKFAVKYHCAVIDFVERLNEYFGSQIVLHFTLTSIVVSLLGFEILMVDDMKESVMYGLHLIGWLIMLYNICFYGQLLIDESIKIAEDAYATPWYRSPTKVQKQIRLIILRAQKPLSLRALDLGIMSHPTFLGVISSSYSYFTLLLKAKNS